MDLRLKTGSHPNPAMGDSLDANRADPSLRLGGHRRAALPRHDGKGEARRACRGGARHRPAPRHLYRRGGVYAATGGTVPVH